MLARGILSGCVAPVATAGQRPPLSHGGANQVEGVQKRAIVSAVVTDEIERGNAVVIAGDRLAVDQAEAHPQCRHRRDDVREARQELSGITIAQRLNLEQEIHHTASELCILGFEPRK